MEIKFESTITQFESFDLHRYKKNVEYYNIFGGLPHRFYYGIIFSIIFPLYLQNFITLSTLSKIIFHVILLFFMVIVTYQGNQKSKLWGYDKSEAKRQIGVTSFYVENNTLFISNKTFSQTFPLKNCKSCFQSFFGTYIVLVFPKEATTYIKINSTNTLECEKLISQILNLTKRKLTKQTKISNIFSPYLEEEKNEDKRSNLN